jgi:hypothetical protein
MSDMALREQHTPSMPSKTRKSELLRLHSKSEALKHLREEISNSDGGIVSDEVLLAISLLATIPVHEQPESRSSLDSAGWDIQTGECRSFKVTSSSSAPQVCESIA